MLQFIFYNLVAMGVAFGFMWLTHEIRKTEPDFLTKCGDEDFAPCVAVSILWPIAAPIAFGILAAKYLRHYKE